MRYISSEVPLNTWDRRLIAAWLFVWWAAGEAVVMSTGYSMSELERDRASEMRDFAEQLQKAHFRGWVVPYPP